MWSCSVTTTRRDLLQTQGRGMGLPRPQAGVRGSGTVALRLAEQFAKIEASISWHGPAPAALKGASGRLIGLQSPGASRDSQRVSKFRLLQPAA